MAARYTVIMAGGSGKRFWPQSREARPKHLQAIVGEQALLAQAVERLQGLVPHENILVITSARQRQSVLEICPTLPQANIIGEPQGRDTAAAVGMAMEVIRARDPQAVFAVLPADHVIHDSASLRRVLSAAFDLAAAEPVLATIGIEPTFAATGYGYIHRGELWRQHQGLSFYNVRRFVEKPSLERAEQFLQSGEFFWNSGMFVWSLQSIDDAFAAHLPQMHAALARIGAALRGGAAAGGVLAREYSQLQKISIDCGVMEKAQNVVTVPAAFDWDDVGEWPALARHYPADAAGNTVKGTARLLDAANNIVVSPDGHLTALIGVDDLIVVKTADVTLICPRSRAQDVKQMVDALAQDEHLSDRV